MRLRFTKMHGLGNDFVVIDAISQRVNLTVEKIRTIADRHFGVGCDQLLIVEIPDNPEVDFRYRIFNNDGAEVENCGNGARCLAKFVRDRKLTGKSHINVETTTSMMTLHIDDNDNVSVDMGIPSLMPADIPFDTVEQAPSYTLTLSDQTQLQIAAISVGNPHAVTLVEDVRSANVAGIGPEVESHTRFPAKANVGFMQRVSRQEINLRVYERSVGETLACGTGACAAVVAGRVLDLLDSEVRVNLPGGSLSITWPGQGQAITMIGPATTVFHGQITI